MWDLVNGANGQNGLNALQRVLVDSKDDLGLGFSQRARISHSL